MRYLPENLDNLCDKDSAGLVTSTHLDFFASLIDQILTQVVFSKTDLLQLHYPPVLSKDGQDEIDK